MAGPLVLVGCGKMGGALLAGWLKRGMAPDRIIVIEPAPNPAILDLASKGMRLTANATALPADLRPEVVVLAVKPQAMDAALAPLGPLMKAEPLILSIAAGRTIGYYHERLGSDAAIVRAMPNTPAAIGRGITVLCANRRASAAQRAVAAELLTAVGEVAWVEDEAAMDTVTALSGSGPAYVFLLVEALAEAGVAQGLDPVLAGRLARVTVAGAGALLEQSEKDAASLRVDVTSPGGTTAAALEVLMAKDGLSPLMRRAVAAAARRARELAE